MSDQPEMPDPPKPVRRGVVAVISRAGCLLFIRRSATVVAPRAICFPGGGIEPGEAEAEALVRELDEELALAIDPGQRIWTSSTRWNVSLAWWSATMRTGAEPIPNPAEVEATYWIEPQAALDLPDLLSSNRQFLESLLAGRITLA